jgi:hypothetical protein
MHIEFRVEIVLVDDEDEKEVPLNVESVYRLEEGDFVRLTLAPEDVTPEIAKYMRYSLDGVLYGDFVGFDGDEIVVEMHNGTRFKFDPHAIDAPGLKGGYE